MFSFAQFATTNVEVTFEVSPENQLLPLGLVPSDDVEKGRGVDFVEFLHERVNILCSLHGNGKALLRLRRGDAAEVVAQRQLERQQGIVCTQEFIVRSCFSQRQLWATRGLVADSQCVNSRRACIAKPNPYLMARHGVYNGGLS